MRQTAGNGTEFWDDRHKVSRLPPGTVKHLAKINAAKAWVSIFKTLAVLATAIAASLIWWTPWVVIPAIIVIAGRQHACFLLAHEAAHYRMFKNRALNDFVGRVFATPIGISLFTYRVLHRLHHNHLYDSRDPDMAVHGGYPRGRAYLATKLMRDVLGLTAYKTFGYFFGAPAINDDADSAKRLPDDTSPLLRKAARQDRWIYCSPSRCRTDWTLHGRLWRRISCSLGSAGGHDIPGAVAAPGNIRARCGYGYILDLQRGAHESRTGVAPMVLISASCKLSPRTSPLPLSSALQSAGLSCGTEAAWIPGKSRGLKCSCNLPACHGPSAHEPQRREFQRKSSR